MTEGYTVSERDPKPIVEALLKNNHIDPKLSRESIIDYLERFGNMEKFLQAFVDAGYLLHGSNQQIEEFEPRLPKKVPGSKPNPANEQTAVYAGNDPALPICMAVVSRELMRRASQERIKAGKPAVKFGVGSKPDSKEAQFHANQSLDSFMQPGYVHVLSRDNFVPSDPRDQNCS